MVFNSTISSQTLLQLSVFKVSSQNEKGLATVQIQFGRLHTL